MDDNSRQNEIAEEKNYVNEIYKNRGFQKQNLKEYLATKKQQEERKKFKLPPAVKIVLASPIIIVFCVGLVFIPYMLYLFFVSK